MKIFKHWLENTRNLSVLNQTNFAFLRSVKVIFFCFLVGKMNRARFCRNYPALPVYVVDACYIIDVVIVLVLNVNGLNAATIINITNSNHAAAEVDFLWTAYTHFYTFITIYSPTVPTG